MREYFSHEAFGYDEYDFSVPKRMHYTAAIDALIVEWIKSSNDAHRLISFAAGTGRREAGIARVAPRPLQVVCVDASDQMCTISQSRGFDTVCGGVQSTEGELRKVSNSSFDIALCLYAFGQITHYNDRLNALRNINASLRFGGTLMFDVFNLHDKDEWGPKIIRKFCEEKWYAYGYDIGDVFYQRIGSVLVSFCHYFTHMEIANLLKSTGFRVDQIIHVDYGGGTGRIVHEPMRGKMFIRATKILESHP